MKAKIRPDGRSDNTLRPLTCELSCLENCDGSALWKAGGTHVLASVHGPIAPRQAQHELHDTCRIQVICKSGATATGTLEREWEGFLARILAACCYRDQYPRCVISVTLQIESADGSVLAAALHAAVSALMDAGLEMRTLPTAVTCLVPTTTTSDTASMIRLDPCHLEEQYPDASVLVVVLEASKNSNDGNDNKILGCHSPAADLQQSVASILQCCSVAGRASLAIQAFWRLAVESKAKREAQTLWSS